ncbi:ribosome biogenesis protein BMS1 homolog, partial [Stegastes partitus]|uniref:Ribosome biogenesis protein BMS1 homolog n=1 Tax=Stegastes partitus TaxID=144197 RepID=A0A9Y4JK38_9TELE
MDGKVKKQKQHQQKHSGPKAEKKKAKKQGGPAEEDARKRNPKAFAVQSAARMAKTFHRAQDIKTKKHHIPLVDRTPLKPPPVVIVVVGPPKVGKSTLIRCLIKNFTRQKLGDICGPVTIVSGKKHRLTFVECNNDINTMIDLAKVADLVLMLIDASFGFEMETFEFLNICQVHGFPRIMGVLTHLDSFKNNKTLRKTKKNLKHRFWTEVYQGAKLFYLSGMVYGEYQTQEVKNLGRFISVMKFRPLVWQTSHPYVLYVVLALLQEEVRPTTELVQSLIDTHATLDAKMAASKVSLFSDSATLDPTDIHEQSREQEGLREKSVWDPETQRERRKVIFTEGDEEDEGDEDEDVSGSSDDEADESEDEEDNNEENLSTFLKEARLKSTKATAGGAPPLKKQKLGEKEGEGGDVEEELAYADSEDELENSSEESESEGETGRARDSGHCSEEEEGESDDEEEEDDEEDSDDESVEEEGSAADGMVNKLTASESEEEAEQGALRWKEGLQQKASEAFLRHQEAAPNLRKLVYGSVVEADDSEDEEEELGGLFRVSRPQKSKKFQANARDSSCFYPDASHNWDLEEMLNSIRDCFVTGKWEEGQDAATLLKEDEELYGDFEDLETGEVHKGQTGQQDEAENSESDDDNDDEGEESLVKVDDDEVQKNKRLEKKRRLKERFDAEYDDDDATYFDDLKEEMQKQAE